jgi:periplasmic protein TonB
MSLQRALLLSIVLHGFLLFAVPERQSTKREDSDPLLLVARLVQAAPTAEPVKAPRPMAKPTRLAAKKVAPVQEPQADAKVEAVADASPPEAAPQPESRPASAQVEAPQFDPGLVARYRLEVISAAKQFRRYPPIARENGWQGRAEVRVSFDGTRQPALAISKSSGYSVLDRQALETLGNALAPLPAMLLGRSFELEFPVVFSLED